MAVAPHYELSSEFLTKLQDTLIELYLGGRVMVLNFKKEVVSEVVGELMLAQEDNNQDLYLTINVGDDKVIDKIITGINRRTRNNNKEVILSY